MNVQWSVGEQFWLINHIGLIIMTENKLAFPFPLCFHRSAIFVWCCSSFSTAHLLFHYIIATSPRQLTLLILLCVLVIFSFIIHKFFTVRFLGYYSLALGAGLSGSGQEGESRVSLLPLLTFPGGGWACLKGGDELSFSSPSLFPMASRSLPFRENGLLGGLVMRGVGLS